MNTVTGILLLINMRLADFKLQVLKQIGTYTYHLIAPSAHIGILILMEQKDLNLLIMKEIKLNQYYKS